MTYEQTAKPIYDSLRVVQDDALVLRHNLGVLLQQPERTRPGYKQAMLHSLDMLAIRIENLKDQIKELP